MDEEEVKKIIREEQDKERTLYVKIDHLEPEDYQRLRNKLKKRVFKLVKGIPCTVSVTDDEQRDIRKKDGW